MLLVGPRRDRPVLSLALGDALTVDQPPPASEVHQRHSGERGDDPPEVRADETDQQQNADELVIGRSVHPRAAQPGRCRGVRVCAARRRDPPRGRCQRAVNRQAQTPALKDDNWRGIGGNRGKE